jgi:hypothetical protein
MSSNDTIAHKAGRCWLTDIAEQADRYVFRDFATGVDWSVLLGPDADRAHTFAEAVCWHLYPDQQGDRKFAAVFWDLQVGRRRPDAVTVRAFVEGAMEAFCVVQKSV